METRFFQHIDSKDDSTFMHVTELLKIDEKMGMYYFKDGFKCFAEFVGDVNDPDVYGTKVITEIPNAGDRWEFDITERKNEKRYTVAKDGQSYEIYDPYNANMRGGQPTKVITVRRKPYGLGRTVAKPSTVISKDAQNTEIKVSKTNNIPNNIRSNQTEDYMFNDVIDLDRYRGHMAKNELTIKYGSKKKQITIDALIKLIDNDEKNEHLATGLNKKQTELVDEMINMSKKKECDIEMTITLDLPAKSVYDMINDGYPSGMSKGFIMTLADRIDVKGLKRNVAEGMLAFYDAEYAGDDFFIEDETEETTVCDNTDNVVEEHNVNEEEHVEVSNDYSMTYEPVSVSENNIITEQQTELIEKPVYESPVQMESVPEPKRSPEQMDALEKAKMLIQNINSMPATNDLPYNTIYAPGAMINVDMTSQSLDEIASIVSSGSDIAPKNTVNKVQELSDVEETLEDTLAKLPKRNAYKPYPESAEDKTKQNAVQNPKADIDKGMDDAFSDEEYKGTTKKQTDCDVYAVLDSLKSL